VTFASRGALFAFALSLSTTPAFAESAATKAAAAKAAAAAAQLEDAKRFAKQGATQYNLAHFADAADSYEKSYEAVPTPGLLFNLGQCHLALKDYEKAVFFFEGYLRALPDAPNAALVNELIAEARRGEAEIKAEAQRQAEAAERNAVRWTPPPPPPKPVPIPFDRRRVVAIPLGGASIAFIGAGVYLGLRAQMLGDQAREQPNTSVGKHFASEHRSYEIGASVVGGIGAAALVASGVFAYLGWRRTPHLGVVATGSGGAISVAGTW